MATMAFYAITLELWISMQPIYFVYPQDIAKQWRAMEPAGFIKVISLGNLLNQTSFLDPGIELSDLHIQVAHVKCDSSATSITDCTSGGWGRGLGDNQGCTQKDIAWLSCEV